MRPMKDIANGLTNGNNQTTTNMPTSSNREGLPLLSDVQAQQDAPFQIVCYDPLQAEKPCPICGGLGVIKYNVPMEDERFGKLYRCPNRPAATDTDHLERLKRLSNLGVFADKTLANFQPLHEGYSIHENKSLEYAFSVAQRYAESPEGWVLFQGKYGCGKTHLAAAIGNARLALGEPVVFVTVPDLLDYLRQSYQGDGDDGYGANFERLRTVRLLILDDLGTENQSEWAKEKLFQLLNHRYTHRLPTVITSNTDIATLDPRLSSRLSDTNLVIISLITAPDFRATHQFGQNNDEPLSRLLMYRDMKFDTFDFHQKILPEERENLIRVTNAAYQYAQNPQGWLLLMGAYGTGKTHLAAAIGNYLEANRQKVMFITVPDLMDYLRTTFDQSVNISFNTLFNSIKQAPYLILDDLGAEAPSAWVQEKLFQLLDYRYVSKLPTVLTTSKPKLQDLNPRIATRLIDKQICRNLKITMVDSYAKRMNR